MKTNTILKITLTAIITLILTCAAGEMYLRYKGHREGVDYRLYLAALVNSDRLPMVLFKSHPTLGITLAPAMQALATTSDFSVFYTINSQGWRDREYTFEKPAGTTRILAFGDSYTFGEGVPYGKRFTDIPEEKIPGVEIINLGVPSWGIGHYVSILQTAAEQYHPDYAFVFINTTDILRVPPTGTVDETGRFTLNELPPHAQLPDPSTARLRADDTLLRHRDAFVEKYSYLAAYMRYRLTLFFLLDRLRGYDKELWDVMERKVIRPHALTMNVTRNQEIIRTRTTAVMRTFNDIARAHGIKVVIVRIDHFGYLDELIKLYGTIDYLRALGDNVTVIDLSEDLQRLHRRRPLTFTYDPHFTPQTHALIGKKLTAIITALPTD